MDNKRDSIHRFTNIVLSPLCFLTVQLSIFFNISNLISCSLAFILREFRLSTLTSESDGGFNGSRDSGGGDLDVANADPPTAAGGGIVGCCSFNKAE